MSSKPILPTLAALIAGCAALEAQTYAFETFAVHNPKAPQMSTFAQGMNNRGAIVGYLNFSVIDPQTHEPTGAFRGFKRYKGGAFDYPLIAPGDGQFFTIAEGIDDSGTIVGRYEDASGFFHGFVLNDGAYTTVDEGGGPNTWVMGIGNAGSFVGSFGSQTPPEHGFVSVNGVMTEFDVPGAASTLATALAHDGTIVGCTGYPNNQAFVRGPNGRYLILQKSQARTTCATGVDNASTTIVGYYIDQALNYHGFVYNYAAGLAAAATEGMSTPALITVDYPGATFTRLTGVDAQGRIAGWAQFIPAQGAEPAFGFIGTPNQ